MRKIVVTLAVVAFIVEVSPAWPLVPDRAPLGSKPDTLLINGYPYELPDWWNSVGVDVPTNLMDWKAAGAHVKREYGSDTGTPDTWRQALKTWALWCREHDHFPVYLAHCHRSGGELERAAQIFADLYDLAHTQKAKKDWYRCYLAHNAGECYFYLREYRRAQLWFARSAAYADHGDPAVQHYARLSRDRREVAARAAAGVVEKKN